MAGVPVDENLFSWTENSDILKKSVIGDSYILEIKKIL